MRVSKEPMEPLRSWKDLFFGEWTSKTKKQTRQLRRRCENTGLVSNTAH